MTAPSGSHLRGLEGTNPLGYFAALGVQMAFADSDAQPRLWWSDDVTPHAVVDKEYDPERIAERALQVFAEWRTSRAMNPERDDGTPMAKADSLKLSPEDLRAYLRQHRTRQAAGVLPSALVAEGSVDNNGVAKPSDLYFAAGQVIFLREARKILEKVSRDDLIAGLVGPWRYRSKLPTMGWDIVDDRVYALRPDDPSKDKKLTNPGPEALAMLGISLYPVFAGIERGNERTFTQGCSGRWKRGSFSWPLWTRPMSPNAVRSVLAQTGDATLTQSRRADSLRLVLAPCSVRQVLTSTIRRSSQGGYGSFGPPRVSWTNQSGPN